MIKYTNNKDVSDFIEKENLTEFTEEALTELNKAFGYNVYPLMWIFIDPEDESKTLMFEVQSENPREADKCLMSFCYDWWFDRIEKFGRIVGFRVSHKSLENK